jgi:trimeric autotransporter adhesin
MSFSPGRGCLKSVFFRTCGFVALVGAGMGACSSAVDNDAAVESITVTPATATVAVGTTLTLGAMLRDADGDPMPGVRVLWTSEDATIASVSQTGVVTGVRVGSVLVAASARGKDSFARLTIIPAPVASVRLSAANHAMFIGDSVRLVAQTLDGAGSVLGRPVTWSTSNATVASVTSDGLVSAITPGGAIITASSEGRSAVASITVSPIAVASISVSPDDNSVVVGQTTQLTAELRDATGAPVTNRVIAWSSSNASVATVTSQGVVTAVAPGSAIITASVDGRSASADVIVTARPASAVILSPGQITIFSGQALQLGALVTDDRGQVLTGRPMSFASSNPLIATVSNTGLVTGLTAGTVTITATSEGASGTATISVTPEPVATLSVLPSTATLSVGQALQLNVIARGATGQSLSLAGRTVSWSTSTPAITSVSSGGLVTALAVGTGVVVLTVDGRQASATLTITVAPVASVVVSPSAPNVNVGQTAQLTATPLSSTGQTLTGRATTWSTSAATVATVSSAGLVTGVGAGTATVTATIEGKSASATVTVQVPISSITMSPSSATVNVAWTTTLTATARNSNNNAIPGVQFTWSSSNTSVATVSSSGVVTGVAPGSATITASAGGKTGTAAITVQLAPIDRIVVTPANPSVKVNNTVQLTATVYDARNNVLTGRTVTWNSSNNNRATVSSTGLVTAKNTGSVTISASSGGKSGSTTVTVTN